MKILQAASEAVPFCKTGLADVVGSLCQKIGASNHDLCLILPKYRSIEAAALQGGMATPLTVPMGNGAVTVSLRYMQWRTVSVYFIDHPSFYDREGIYGRDGHDHPDNDLRYILYSRAVLEACKLVGFKPDILHCHDWQSSLTAAYLKHHYKEDPFFQGTSSLLTIHNLAYQGLFPRASLDAAGFGSDVFVPNMFEFYGKFSFLKAGIVSADALTTVSPTYSQEIRQSSERGFGLEGELQRRSQDLTGILNGIDTDLWNPEKDVHLVQRYGLNDFKNGKARCKAALQKECGLNVDPKIPLLAVVSRLDYQKGLDLAIKALEPRLGSCQLVVLGSGDVSLHEAFASLSRKRPGHVYFHSGFNESLAHRIYAGSDLFLMPSRFEPCGLGQMIALRYGSVPVVSRTGGLADTIFESEHDGKNQNGFLFAANDTIELTKTLERALKLYGKPSFADLIAAGMSGDYSWGKSLQGYMALYSKLYSRGKA